jgi:hypothetical protein
MMDANEVYEVLPDGRLSVNGRVLPLGRGFITVALLKAGWRGAEGVLPLDLARKAIAMDPRLRILSALPSIILAA